MQILLIVSKPVVKDLLSINIKSFLGVDVIVRTNSAEAVDLLAILPEIDLIISDKESAFAMAEYLTNNKKQTSLIVLGDKTEEISGIYPITQFLAESDWEEIVTLSAKSLGIRWYFKEKKAQRVYSNPGDILFKSW